MRNLSFVIIVILASIIFSVMLIESVKQVVKPSENSSVILYRGEPCDPDESRILLEKYSLCPAEDEICSIIAKQKWDKWRVEKDKKGYCDENGKRIGRVY